MYNKSYQNPQTTQLLRKFFAGPFTLAIAISSSISVLLTLALPWIETGIPAPDIPSALIAVGFFILYFKAKSTNPLPSFKAPLNIIMISSIIEASIMGFFLIPFAFVCIFFLLFVLMFPPLVIGWLLLIGILLMLFPFAMYFIGLAVVSGSMKSTLKTGILKRKSSVFTAVTGIILFSFIVVILIISFISFDYLSTGILPTLEEAITSSITHTPAATGNEFAVSNLAVNNTSATGILSAISLSAFSVNILLTSFYLLKFNSYIKKVSVNYIPVVPQPVYPNNICTPHSQVNMPAYQNNYTAPVSPQTIPTTNYNNALAPEIDFGEEHSPKDDRTICPVCNSKVEPSINYCPQCGYQFIEQNMFN